MRDEDGKRYHRYAHPEDPSAWFIYENKTYMHCVGVYGWALLTNHSIDPSGEVNASVLCTDGTGAEYHEMVIFDDWPSDMKKLAGEEAPQKI